MKGHMQRRVGLHKLPDAWGARARVVLQSVSACVNLLITIRSSAWICQIRRSPLGISDEAGVEVS